MLPLGPHFLPKREGNFAKAFTSMVANDPVNITGDIYSVNSSPARDSGLCRCQGLGHISGSLSPSLNSASVTHS